MDGEASSKFRRICVFCGSKSGNKQAFSDAALELGNELVKRKINLVYGGGSVGLMGLISRTVHDGGRHVLGVIPAALMPLEISGQPVGEVKIVSDMHERKAEMARKADAFIALPGGYGTMEELLEMITWSQLGIHNKPVGLLNVDGYYNPLLALFDNGVNDGFIKPGARHILLSASTATELIEKMEQYTPLHDHVAPTKSWEIERLDFDIRKAATGKNKQNGHLCLSFSRLPRSDSEPLLPPHGRSSQATTRSSDPVRPSLSLYPAVICSHRCLCLSVSLSPHALRRIVSATHFCCSLGLQLAIGILLLITVAGRVKKPQAYQLRSFTFHRIWQIHGRHCED